VIAAGLDGCLRYGRAGATYQPLSHGEGVERCDRAMVPVMSAFART